MLRLLSFLAIPCLFAWPALAQAQTAAPAEHDCVVRQFVTARQVNNLEPQGEVERYEAGTERGYAFARLDCTNVGSGETFYFRWMQGDREVTKSRARVDVSRNWRIWSQVRLSPGEWVVQLQDSGGRVQAERKFSVAAPAATE
ncbi:DUF2914 domain-containing protein [Ferrovibrio sp.]|uniref:DUF2914 domain-containing protein n=1 Tax=Ferrovibrio sp. TaxID=1917215 RepID=UPI003D29F981